MNVAAVALLLAIVGSLVATLLLPHLLLPPTAPEHLRISNPKVVGRGVPGGFSILVVNPNSFSVTASVPNYNISTDVGAYEVKSLLKSAVPPDIRIVSNGYEIYVDLSGMYYIYSTGYGYFISSIQVLNNASYMTSEVALINAQGPGEYVIYVNKSEVKSPCCVGGWCYYVCIEPSVTNEYVFITNASGYLIIWKSNEGISAILVKVLSSTESIIYAYVLSDERVYVSNSLCDYGPVSGIAGVETELIRPCMEYHILDFVGNREGEEFNVTIYCVVNDMRVEGFVYWDPPPPYYHWGIIDFLHGNLGVEWCRAGLKRGHTYPINLSIDFIGGVIGGVYVEGCYGNTGTLLGFASSGTAYVLTYEAIDVLKVKYVPQEPSHPPPPTSPPELAKSVSKLGTQWVGIIEEPASLPTYSPPTEALVTNSSINTSGIKGLIIYANLTTPLTLTSNSTTLTLKWSGSKVIAEINGSTATLPATAPKAVITWVDSTITIETDTTQYTTQLPLPKGTIHIEGNATAIELSSQSTT